MDQIIIEYRLKTITLGAKYFLIWIINILPIYDENIQAN